jgi:hypothetical protein
MTSSPPLSPEAEQALAQRFTVLVGRGPTVTELHRYRQARSRAALRLPHRLRRSAARLIARM